MPPAEAVGGAEAVPGAKPPTVAVGGAGVAVGVPVAAPGEGVPAGEAAGVPLPPAEGAAELEGAPLSLAVGVLPAEGVSEAVGEVVGAAGVALGGSEGLPDGEERAEGVGSAVGVACGEGEGSAEAAGEPLLPALADTAAEVECVEEGFEEREGALLREGEGEKEADLEGGAERLLEAVPLGPGVCEGLRGGEALAGSVAPTEAEGSGEADTEGEGETRAVAEAEPGAEGDACGVAVPSAEGEGEPVAAAVREGGAVSVGDKEAEAEPPAPAGGEGEGEGEADGDTPRLAAPEGLSPLVACALPLPEAQGVGGRVGVGVAEAQRVGASEGEGALEVVPWPPGEAEPLAVGAGEREAEGLPDAERLGGGEGEGSPPVPEGGGEPLREPRPLPLGALDADVQGVPEGVFGAEAEGEAQVEEEGARLEGVALPLGAPLPNALWLASALRDAEPVPVWETPTADGGGVSEAIRAEAEVAALAAALGVAPKEVESQAERVEDGEGMEGKAVPVTEGEPEGGGEALSCDGEGGAEGVAHREAAAVAVVAEEEEGVGLPLREAAGEAEAEALPAEEREGPGDLVGSAPEGVGEPVVAREDEGDALPGAVTVGMPGEAVGGAVGDALPEAP